jgi:hypothetical protein
VLARQAVGGGHKDEGYFARYHVNGAVVEGGGLDFASFVQPTERRGAVSKNKEALVRQRIVFTIEKEEPKSKGKRQKLKDVVSLGDAIEGARGREAETPCCTV